ncbi:hypothetical protein SAMN05421853_1278 [Roseivivax halotolerans]|uniref:Uncharacterized protein n=1 Tax=Roseivivax halotolerans TaxID=93684 RepID=A0A1I6AN81_9RHOB|nr:hypothetical protein SAMN05421853_1278 [Roseivivax halotolerans]
MFRLRNTVQGDTSEPDFRDIQWRSWLKEGIGLQTNVPADSIAKTITGPLETWGECQKRNSLIWA